MCADGNFTHAYGVYPQHLAIGDRLFDLGAIATKALAKTVPPVTPAQHLQEIVRRTEPEKDYEQKVIKTPHGL